MHTKEIKHTQKSDSPLPEETPDPEHPSNLEIHPPYRGKQILETNLSNRSLGQLPIPPILQLRDLLPFSICENLDPTFNNLLLADALDFVASFELHDYWVAGAGYRVVESLLLWVSSCSLLSRSSLQQVFALSSYFRFF